MPSPEPQGTPPAASDSDESRVRDLVAECLERFEDEGPAAIEATCAAHPGFAPQIRAALDSLARVGLLRREAEAGERFPERLGEFKLIRRLGSGGMGIVFLAEQTSLGRQVALKVVKPGVLYFGQTRERFRREAQLIATLRHPGIVPVFAFGEAGDLPYYAMEYVDGASLDAVLDKLRGRDPTRLTEADVDAVLGRAPGAAPLAWVPFCLGLAQQIAEALAHAHECGVVHRDVKPSNVMLTRDRRVRLVDFGLSTRSKGTRITRSGSELGSLPYMSPELLRSGTAAVDARSDVYALGVTLYELLTLHAPFEAADDELTRRAILAGAPRRPREVNPALPADAEAVCLTALDVDPARRYATAAALARDLGHVLALRPIEAKPAGTGLRVKRWVQRHPTRSVAALATAIGLVAVPTLLWLQSRAANQKIWAALVAETDAKLFAQHQKLVADQQTAEATRQRDAARASYIRTINAIDAFLVKFGSQRLAGPALSGIRKEMSEKALGFYEGIYAESHDDPSLRRETAFVRTKLVALKLGLGRESEAFELVDARVRELTEQLASKPDDPDLVYELGMAWFDVGLARYSKSSEAVSEAAFRKSIAYLEKVAGADDSAARMLARDWSNVASIATWAGREPESIEASRAAVDALAPVVERAPGQPENRLELGHAQMVLAEALGFAGRDAEAEEMAGRSEQQLALAVQKYPNEHDYFYAYAGVLIVVGDQRIGKRDYAGAEERLRKAVAIRQRIVAGAQPASVYHYDLGEALDLLAAALAASQRGKEARELFEQARTIQEPLVAAHPENAGYRSELAVTLGGLADLAREEGELDGARTQVLAAIEQQKRALAADPADPDLPRRMLRHQIVLGRVLLEKKSYAEAVRALRDGFEAGRRQRRSLGELATACAHSLTSLTQDAELDEADLEARSHELAALALEVFDLQIARGETTKQALLEVPEYSPLRDRDEVREWTKSSAPPAEHGSSR